MSTDVAAYIVVAVDAYAQIIELALPITFLIGAVNIGINCIYSAFIGKRIHFGGD